MAGESSCPILISDSDSEDQDIKRAIAMSLQVQDTAPQLQAVVDLSRTDWDTAAPTDDVRKVSPVGKSVEVTVQEVTSKTDPGLAGLDRAAMERERLGRQRRRQDKLDGESTHRVTVDLGNISTEPRQASTTLGTSGSSTKRPLEPETMEDGERKRPKTSTTPAHVAAPTNSGVQFLNPTVKLTWVYNFPRTPQQIKIEEVLQKDTLQHAILSAFQWDVIWVLTKLKIPQTSLVLVQHAKSPEIQDHIRRQMRMIPNTEVVFPNLDKARLMHSKLQILFHPTHVRVVVPTANLVPYDWGETGIMENSTFIQDFPKRTGPGAESAQPKFLTHLTHFCRKQGIPETSLSRLNEYDFGNATAHFVGSIGGEHFGRDVYNSGFPALGTAVREIGSGVRKVDVDYITSSLGSLNANFLGYLMGSMQGKRLNRMWECNSRSKNAKGSISGINRAQKETTDEEDEEEGDTESAPEMAEIERSFRVLFPTSDTVAKSRGGPNSGGTICFQPTFWTKPDFPRKLMRDCRSVRDGCLMHNKQIYARFKVPVGGNAGWVYVGSHNLSSSAWGDVTMDRAQKGLKLKNWNWECGVVLPVPEEEDLRDAQAGTDVLWARQTAIPVPAQLPAMAYREGQNPWMFTMGR
ncbi:hypothetical protein YB2330_003460 [Saitoella coloradoensis]